MPENNSEKTTGPPSSTLESGTSTAIRLDELLSTGKIGTRQIEEQKALPSHAEFRKFMFRMSSNALLRLPKEQHKEFQEEIIQLGEMTFGQLTSFIYQLIADLKEASFNIESAVEAMEIGAYDLVKLGRKIIRIANSSFNAAQVTSEITPFKDFAFEIPNLRDLTVQEFTPNLFKELETKSNNLFDHLKTVLWDLGGKYFGLKNEAEMSGDDQTLQLLESFEEKRKLLLEEVRTLKTVFEVNLEKLENEIKNPDPVFKEDINSRNADKYKLFYSLCRLFQISSETKSSDKFEMVLDILYSIEPEETSRITPLTIKTLPSTFISPEEIRTLRLFFVSAFIDKPLWMRNEINEVSRLYDSLLSTETSLNIITSTLSKSVNSLRKEISPGIIEMLEAQIKKTENGLIVRDSKYDYVMIGIDSEFAKKTTGAFCEVFREFEDLVPNFPHGQNPQREPLYNPKTCHAPLSPITLEDFALTNPAGTFEDAIGQVINRETNPNILNLIENFSKNQENIDTNSLLAEFQQYSLKSTHNQGKFKAVVYTIFNIISGRVEDLNEDQIADFFRTLETLNYSYEFFVEEIRALNIYFIYQILRSAPTPSHLKSLSDLRDKLQQVYGLESEESMAHEKSINLWNLQNPINANLQPLVDQNPWQIYKVVALARVRRDYFAALAELQPGIEEAESVLRRKFADNPKLRALLVNELHQVESGISDRFLNARKKTLEAGFIRDIHDYEAEKARKLKAHRRKRTLLKASIGFTSISSIAFAVSILALFTIDKEEGTSLPPEIKEIETRYRMVQQKPPYTPTPEITTKTTSAPTLELEVKSESKIQRTQNYEIEPGFIYPQTIDGAHVRWLEKGNSIIEEITCPTVNHEEGTDSLGPDGLRCVYKDGEPYEGELYEGAIIYDCGTFTSHFDPTIQVSLGACEKE